MTLCLTDFELTESQHRWRGIERTWKSSKWLLTYWVLLLCVAVLTEGTPNCGSVNCLHGFCENQTTSLCVCDRGWVGRGCDRCGGRIRLNSTEGYITDGVGNYTLNTKCSWLLEGPVNASVQLQLDHFATECSWDHLYVYDGDSIFAPRIAAFSGLVIIEAPVNMSLPRVTARSGSVYLHFFSDAAYNMSGFNISYTVRGCPMNCSGRGWCQPEDQTCQCDTYYTGDACHIRLCPGGCGGPGRGECLTNDRGPYCKCAPGFRGMGCEQESHQGAWYYMIPQPGADLPSGRASHKSVVHKGHLWVVSGEQFTIRESQNIVRYDFHNDRWETVPVVGDSPEQRYGHSLIYHQDGLYMYGGLRGKVITDDLWRFDINAYTWELVEGQPNNTGKAVVGHTAHVIDGVMYVIFGHSPVYGYMNTVQEYNISAGTWTIDNNTKGAIVKGGYGHSSVYDPSRSLIYVHAGYHSISVSNYLLSDTLYSFDPRERHWRILQASGQFKYLHSAVIISDLMLVFGGNTHNDTSKSKGAKCYSADFLAYDMKCNKWSKLTSPKLDQSISRFGHIAEVNLRNMYIFGGFNGLMLNDMFKYEPGNCKSHASKESCLAAREGVKCVWSSQGCLLEAEALEKKGKKVISTYETGECHDTKPSPEESEARCSEFVTCPSCMETTYSCQWCDDRCSVKEQCERGEVDKSEECKANHKSQCSQLHNCHSCQSDEECRWEKSDKSCIFHTGRIMKLATADRMMCKASCHMHVSCENCTASSCMWCSNQERCVESNSYVASFPYGQCMEWTTQIAKCPATRCSELATCEVCQANPACGWCDDESHTGLGTCMEGGNSGPMERNDTTTPWLRMDKCPAERWFFTNCPECQCNGHSKCTPATNVCENCQDLTTGEQCQYCTDGFFGNPINGGNCSACECNGQADKCHHRTGVCYCRTRGMIGDHCDQCDEAHRYFGNPKNGGTCYYDLTTDYQFTFNLSKEEDKYYTNINFMNVPEKPDRDVDFNLNCSDKALLNITVKSKSQQNEVRIIENHQCRNFKMKLYHKEYVFGREANTTFYVSVFDFKTPIWLQISFSQFQQIDLVHFFVTFFSCFLSLLLLAAIFWKVRQRFTHYRHRQRMVVELEQMAARPFATCAIEVAPPSQGLSPKKEPPDQRSSRRKKSHSNKLNKPSPVAMEPLHGHRQALLALIVRLPTGDEDYTPPGQSGLTIASALVTLGNPRKTSVEHSKGDKSKTRKLTAHHMENCI